MRRKLLWISAVLLLLLLFVPAGLVYYAAFTERGLQFIVEKVPRRIGRVQLEIEGAHGTLAHGFQIDRVEIEHERSHLRFEGIEGELKLLPLLWQTLQARDLHVREAHIEVRRRKRPIPKYTPRFLPPGLIIRTDRVRVDAGTLVAPNGRRYEGSELETSGVVRHRTIRIFDVAGTVQAMRITGAGELRAADPMQLSADLRINVRIQGQPEWVIAVSGEGDLNEVDLTANFTEPFRADFAGQALTLTRGWHWQGKAQIHNFSLQPWGGGETLGRITGELDLRGDARGFVAEGPVTPAGLRAGAFDMLFEGAYSNRTVTARRVELTHKGSAAYAEGAGTITLSGSGPQLDVKGRWRNFRWPLVGENVPLRSAAGEYTLSGTWPYAVTASGAVSIREFEAMPFELSGSLAKNELTLQQAHVQAFGGRADFVGHVAWSPQDRWDLRGRATAVNPHTLRPDLPGKLNFAFDASGTDFGAEADYAIALRDISGTLRGVRASGSGRVSRQDGVWDFERVRMRLGGTSLALHGKVAEQLNLEFEIEADNLSLVSRDTRGKLLARGTLRGTAEEPVVRADVRGNNISHDRFELESLAAQIDFDSKAARPSRIDLQARNVAWGERRLSALSLELDGPAGDHVVRLSGTASNLRFAAEATGAFAAGFWQGQLSRLDLNGTEALHLELESPVALAASRERMRLDWFCLRGMPARVCADAQWSPAMWSATLTASDLPMSTLTSGLTPAVEYRGTIGILARAFGEGGGPAQGALRVDLVDARIAHRLASGRVERITLGSGLVTANATLDAIDSQVSLDAGEIGTVKGNVRIARSAPRWQDMPLTGDLNLQTAELGFLTIYLPEIDRAAGRLRADLDLAGTLGTPLIDGTLHLTEAELDLYQINLAMRRASLEARLHENGLDFSGGARIGQGEVQTKGRLEWQNALPYGKFSIQGENLRLVDIPEAQIDASPNLDFRIQGRKIEVTGAVTVPYARIAPTDTSGTVRVSEDEVIVGEEPVDPSQRFEVSTGVRLSLGDKVSVDTAGLTGRLTGAITVRSGREELTTATGELSIEEGKYTAYGRQLDIQRGRLIFTGGAVNNPGVDIRAIKEYPEVRAGVNVRGTLLQPRLTFFSEPSLPQSQIVSLILAGGAALSATQRNGQNQATAGNELLAQGGAILAQQLGSRIGIEDVSLESNPRQEGRELANETSLVLGKYLSPRLYVSYGISFTESLNTLKLRYSLDDRWTIKTEFGEARSADLVYTIEK